MSSKVGPSPIFTKYGMIDLRIEGTSSVTVWYNPASYDGTITPRLHIIWGDGHSDQMYSTLIRPNYGPVTHEYAKNGTYEIRISGTVSIRNPDATTQSEDISKTASVTIDSYTHNVIFDTAGGSEVAAQTIKGGEAVVKPDDPSKDGFVFYRWLLNNQEYDFSKPVNEDITLHAEWYEKLRFTSAPPKVRT